MEDAFLWHLTHDDRLMKERRRLRIKEAFLWHLNISDTRSIDTFPVSNKSVGEAESLLLHDSKHGDSFMEMGVLMYKDYGALDGADLVDACLSISCRLYVRHRYRYPIASHCASTK